MFDPTDPSELEQLATELQRHTGRTWAIPAPFEVPTDPGDPATEWQTYPEDPAVRHHHPATGTTIDVSFPGGGSFRVFGWVGMGRAGGGRVFDHTGRFAGVGPGELAEVLAGLIAAAVAGDPPAGD